MILFSFNMMLHPNNILFFLMIIFSSIMMISVDSWLLMWIFLEVNMISIIPFFMEKKNKYQSESTLKYFLIQAISSIFFLLSVIFMYKMIFMKFLMMTSLMIKMGAAPVHQWLINLSESLSWTSLFLLFTVQKIGVFIILSNNMLMENLILLSLFFISSSAMLGSIGALFQSSFRKILAYSSISNKSWLISSLYLNDLSWVFYFLFYSFMLFLILILINKFKMSKISNFMNIPKKFSLFLCMNLLSMAGLPPFTGFFNKMVVLIQINKMNLSFIILPLLLGSLISLFFYIRMSFFIMTMTSSTKIYLQKNMTPLFLLFNTIGLFLGMLFLMLN